MGRSPNPIIFLAFQVFFLIANGSTKPSSDHHGLSVKLNHRDSPESPLYRPGLTETQRTRNLALQSKSRSLSLAGHDPNALRSRLEHLQNSVYMVQLGIGTFGDSTILYFLHMDTGTSLTWTQCEGCQSTGRRCFHQKQPIFPDSRSRSYRKLPSNRHPLCFPNQCAEGSCTYSVNASTEGFLATETFAFRTDSPPAGREAIPGIIFGYGFNQRSTGYGDAGEMGLGWGTLSLPAQLWPRGQRRFSYCLHPDASSSFLRFGTDIPNTPGRRATGLVQVGSLQPYHVTLLDVSVADQRLRLPAHFFNTRPHNARSGVAIDAGTAYSSIVQPAYDSLERAVLRYSASRIPGLTRVHVPGSFDLCFQRPGPGTGGGFSDLPSVTFHFGGNTDMVVPPEGVFHLSGVRRETICLAVVPVGYDVAAGGLSLIGAYQQTNQRVIFEVGRKKLHFGPENCARNG